ncbi:MAG: hypothetical protein RJA70_4225 [Pseudomonadota bacterium]|jgi:GNAT superfamily N-acetyltransferase
MRDFEVIMPLQIVCQERARRQTTVITLEARDANGTTVGRIVLECGDSIVYLEDIWIEPDQRGRGYGDSLLKRGKAEAVRRCGRVLQCDPIAYEPKSPGTKESLPEEKQKGLRDWYKNRGFAPLDDADGGLWECKLLAAP